MGSPVCQWRAWRCSTSGSVIQCSKSCDGSSTKSRSTCVPDSRSKVTLDSSPCRPWPNSWNSVRASSSDSSVGSPGAPLAKLLLFRITGSSRPAPGAMHCGSAAQRAHPGAAALVGAREVVLQEQAHHLALASLHLVGLDVGVVDRQVVARVKRRPNSRPAQSKAASTTRSSGSRA
jgi:hypothetical protein